MNQIISISNALQKHQYNIETKVSIQKKVRTVPSKWANAFTVTGLLK